VSSPGYGRDPELHASAGEEHVEAALLYFASALLAVPVHGLDLDMTVVGQLPQIGPLARGHVLGWDNVLTDEVT
jgi:hypothetical protein